MIATHNRSSDLCRTLEKLQSLEPKPLEIFVVLDGCTDGSKKEVETRFPEIIVINNTAKQGSVPARDTAFRMANADIIVSLDDDSYPLQTDFVARVAQLASEHPEAGIFAFREVRLASTSYQPSSREQVGRYVNSYPNCAGAIRRSLYGRGVSYPRFFCHAYEEPDSCLQAYGVGYAVWYEPSITILHHATRVGRNAIATHHFHARNEFWSVILRCPVPHCFWVGPYRALRQLLYAASRGWPWLKKEPHWWASAVSGIGQCLKERQPVSWRTYWNWMRLTHRPIVNYDDLLRRFHSMPNRKDCR